MRQSEPLRDRARNLRRDQTDAERLLWMRLRARQIDGLKFRRQHPIGPYIVDFCCPGKHLVVELDGGQHAGQTSADQLRTAFLTRHGYQVVRYWNHEVLTDPDTILQHIAHAARHPHPNPLPKRARERRPVKSAS